MNVFELRDRLIADYASYISSFIYIRDDRVRRYVEESLESGLLWPPPLIQLNPSFEPSKSIGELVAEGVLHPECAKVFHADKDRQPGGRPLRLHLHQEQAIRAARDREAVERLTDAGYTVIGLNHGIGCQASLRRSLVLYRMVFGQNRQEDLLNYLSARLPAEEIEKITNLCRIDLAPPATGPISPDR